MCSSDLDLPEALENNYNFVFRCNFRPFSSKPILPNISSDKEGNADEILKKNSVEGLKEKFISSFGISENNYLGEGVKLGTDVEITTKSFEGRLFINEPNYKNSNRSLQTTIESTTSDFLSTGGFKTSRTGFGIGTGFEQLSDLYVNLDISAYYEKLETTSTASAFKKKQEGDYIENLFTYDLTLNKLIYFLRL